MSHINNNINNELTEYDKMIYKMIETYFIKIVDMSEINKISANHNVCSIIYHHYNKGRLTVNDKLKDYCEKINLKL